MTDEQFRAAVLNEVLFLICNKTIVVDGQKLIVTVQAADMARVHEDGEITN
jgi:hypothetical protein